MILFIKWEKKYDDRCIRFLLIIILLCSIIYIGGIIRIKNKIFKLMDSALEVTPREFFNIRNASLGGRGKNHISTNYDFAGVYILFNLTKNMYYVGQGKKAFQRVNSHFTGHGNRDVYADYKYGDDFRIKMISLENSGFNSLNELERNTIMTYNAYSKGYNKTRGNRR